MPSRQSIHAPDDTTQALGGKIDVLPQTQHTAKDSAEAGVYDNIDLNAWSAGSLPVMMGNCRKSYKIRPFLSLMPLVLTVPVSLCVCGYVGSKNAHNETLYKYRTIELLECCFTNHFQRL